MSRTPGDLTSARVRWGSQTLAIARRELDSYFATPLGWVAMTGFVFITGFFFTFFLFQFNQYAVSAGFVHVDSACLQRRFQRRAPNIHAPINAPGSEPVTPAGLRGPT